MNIDSQKFHILKQSRKIIELVDQKKFELAKDYLDTLKKSLISKNINNNNDELWILYIKLTEIVGQSPATTFEEAKDHLFSMVFPLPDEIKSKILTD